jgi:hypothetical protein
MSCWTGKETKEHHSLFFDTKTGKEMICCPNKNQQPFKRKEGLKELYFRASSSYNPRETRWTRGFLAATKQKRKKRRKGSYRERD